ncbi:hypothetical protein SARC_08880 [Sphaeroforma arctica JP610]|uniref:Uncharacterized protein n=1 Tax=Sphaeroforma arctica JP610 TaxID=667725 RepID=A0A0L0FQ89_9EUKA|nr:hypothetical protein SARC_08880 [Sphaeroforma arctica JP610]KNC78691.1 hypothetical protein SARC_08880 [Sphaeroforma arctica JP610]|eukprot:XP_014152593.1 hypothetical protein SARC_08880 [Sphaeroforma arctica JP610]
MGGHLVTYFMKWVESDLGGKGGKGWVAKHLHAFVGLASSALGMPKSVGALLSGEFKDTSALGGLNHLIDSNTLLGRAARAKLLQTWRSMYQMMPKGGDALWGNGIDSVDDFGENGTCHYMLTVFPNDAQNQKCRDGCSTPVPNFLTDGYSEMCERDEMMPNVTMSTFLDHFLTSQFANTAPILKQFSYGYSDTPEDNDDDPLKWYNALEFQLPNAPDMTIYSIYGIGKNTERGYAYQVLGRAEF